MKTLEAFNHGNGTLTVFIREQEHISYLRNKGVKENLRIGDILLTGEDRKAVYPTLTEAMQPAVARYLNTLENDYQDSLALAGELD